MGVLHGLLVAGAIGLIAVAPCLVCLVLIHADDVLQRVGERCRHRWQLLRLGRSLPGMPDADRARPIGPPIEQVAGDLRRLNRLRGDVAMRTRVWFVAVQRAYDDVLHVACAQLGVEEHLEELTGVDLDLERLRLEGELQRAGLVLRDAGAQQR